MKRIDLLKSATASGGSLVLGQGGSMSASGTAIAASPADSELDALLAADWSDTYRRHPIMASLDGDRSGDTRWDDQSLRALADEADHQRVILARVEALAREPLSPASALNAELYAGKLRDALRAYDLRTYLFAISPRDGVQTYAGFTEQLPFAAPSDYAAWQARLEAYPVAVDQTIALLREAIAQRMLWPRESMQRLPAQIDRVLAAGDASPFFAPYLRVPAAIPTADASRLRDRARATIANAIVPALHRLRAFITDVYLPHAPLEVGLAHVPHGEALYAYFAQSYTTTTMTPDAIHALGLSEVARIRAEMEALAPQTGYRGTLAEIFTQLRADPANYHHDRDSLLLAYRAAAKRTDPELARFFHLSSLPRLPYGVTPIPDALAPDTTTAYYYPGALDGSRAGLYYVNLYRPEARPIYEMTVLSLHESVPGHHLQIALAQELQNLPTFRQASLGYTAYIEGWGLYAESLGHDMGLYDDPKSLFGALTYEMWRAVRLVVDTGMHARGWSRQRAIEYFLANAAKTPLDVENEIDRYITNPGQALAYKIGQLKILELRARARQKLGSRFDLKDFHAVVLGAGALPLATLERRVDAWIAGGAVSA